MNIGKALAISAVTGILMGVSGCGGAQMPDASSMAPKVPSAGDVTPAAAKDCCKGKNTCKGTSGCKAGDNATCAGKNDCKGKGTSCPKPS